MRGKLTARLDTCDENQVRLHFDFNGIVDS